MVVNPSGNTTVTLKFTKSEIDYIRTKFEIKDKEDFVNAIKEMISTYMELD